VSATRRVSPSSTNRITREQREALAQLVLAQVGNLVEFWSEYTERDPALADLDALTARDQLATWMRRLPGEAWDIRLNMPNC